MQSIASARTAPRGPARRPGTTGRRGDDATRPRAAATLTAGLIGVLLFAAGAARAQTDLPRVDDLEPAARSTRVETPDMNPSQVLPGTVDPDQYVVGPGDIFQLNLSGRLTRTHWLAVGPEGVLYVPGGGAVSVGGLTLRQAQREVERRLGAQFREVSVDLRLARVRSMRVFVTGEVNPPGSMEVSAASRVGEMLTGPSLKSRASRRNITITRRNGERQVADLERWNRTGRDAFNPPLRDGDVVNVPVATTRIEIAGAVAREGATELGPDDSLSTLFELGGGPLPSARREGCLLVRWKSATEAESLMFSLDQLERGEFNPPLRNGDRAYVYHVPRYHELEQAVAFGEIARPGVYPLVSGKTRLSDLLEAAGGFLPGADLSAIRLYRPSTASQEADPELDRLLRLSRAEMSDAEYTRLQTRLAARHEEYRVDWARIRREPELDPLLRGGDVVRVSQTLSSIRVDGEVRRPGVVAYDPGRSVESYIQLVGGFGARAARGKVQVTRSVTGQTLRARDVPSLSPGDLIWVPVRPDRTAWQDLSVILVAAAQVATIVIAVRK